MGPYDVDIPAGAMVDLFGIPGVAAGDGLRIQNRSDADVLLFSTLAEPTLSTPCLLLGPEGVASSTIHDPGAWAYCRTDAHLTVWSVPVGGWRIGSDVLPPEVLLGERALNVQFYDESNKKLGSQWTAARRLTGATSTSKYYSILKTRTLPLDLKARVFSYTGTGLIANFYNGFSAVTLPAPEPVYSLRPTRPAFRDFDLYALAAPPADLGTLWASPLVLEGPAQIQGKGSPNAVVGTGWIIDPGEEILLEIISLDSQNISATLSMFNGKLDLPNE